jgi:hypothetical protein
MLAHHYHAITHYAKSSTDWVMEMVIFTPHWTKTPKLIAAKTCTNNNINKAIDTALDHQDQLKGRVSALR